MFLVLALAFGLLCFLSKGNKVLSFIFGVIAFLSLVTWFKTGVGFDFLNWTDNPKVPEVDIPDNIPLPGGN